MRDVSVRDVVSALRGRMRLCIAVFIICTLVAIAAAVLMKPVYRSEILLFPVERDSGSGALLRQFGGIAALAGAKPSSSQQSEFAVATLRSHEFAVDFIERNSLLPTLLPAPSLLGRVLSGFGPPKPRTIEDAVKVFLKRVEYVDVDTETGVVKLSVEFSDREKTAQWANDIVTRINDEMRNVAISQSRLRLEFLNAELKKTTIVGVQSAIFNLIEEETKSIMLANTERDFAFRPVERATVPAQNDFVRPRRLLLIASGAIAGLLLAVLIGLFSAATRRG